MKKLFILLIAGGVCAMILSACKKSVPVRENNAPVQEGIWKVILDYDMYSGNEFRLYAVAADFDENGAQAHVEKRVGPMNYTGVSKVGELHLSRSQADALLEILSRYDLKAYSALRHKGTGSAPSRSLMVFDGAEQYDVAWDAVFPETIPPEQDVMYFELFNFFNDRIREEPGWEDVCSENLKDPRDNPAYAERIVSHFGREVRLAPGTGTSYADGRGARIDYGDAIWWLEEGFIGVWRMSEQDAQENDCSAAAAEFRVGADGQITLTLDGEVWTGTLPDTRYYKEGTGARITCGTERRSLLIDPAEQDSWKRLHLSAYPGPVPEEQFDPIDVWVTKQN